VHLFSVDNVLIKVCDPTFVGFTALNHFQMTSKTVPRASPDEAVGVIVLSKGRPAVVEYSEMPKEISQAINEDGSLRFNTGSICNHIFTLRFLRLIVTGHLQDLNTHYHIALKKIPFVDSNGTRTVPTQPNGIKFELFYYDAIRYAETTGVLQVKRSDEFAPVKNAPGSAVDSPDTARMLIKNLHSLWLTKAGAKFQEGSVPDDRVEISPLISYEGEGLETFAGQTLNYPVYIYY